MTIPNETELEIQKRNFRYVQIDAIGVSISNVAAPFLPVFLTRLGASNFQVGLLSSMQGMTGLILAILVGRFLQTRTNVVPWYSLSRLLVILCYALTGVLTLAVSEQFVIIATLAIWAFATIPQPAVGDLWLDRCDRHLHRHACDRSHFLPIELCSHVHGSVAGRLLQFLFFEKDPASRSGRATASGYPLAAPE